ncbi:hypothetical protein [Leptothoe kymatousa]|nr:hypothetical protein [Leptothoe kymatousa]
MPKSLFDQSLTAGILFLFMALKALLIGDSSHSVRRQFPKI